MGKCWPSSLPSDQQCPVAVGWEEHCATLSSALIANTKVNTPFSQRCDEQNYLQITGAASGKIVFILILECLKTYKTWNISEVLKTSHWHSNKAKNKKANAAIPSLVAQNLWKHFRLCLYVQEHDINMWVIMVWKEWVSND